ncbi:MAG TPA: sigma-70 family RNA polymerase sigma factor [Vicinamibacteria bacterium]|nr:sigma-70 family RNA polymerase sigma factor [Vicinamibacteria bacterium]
MELPTDGELMDRVKRGDRAAFAALVDRHKNGLVGFLATLVRDRNRAEELAQDTFVRLYERRGRYEERGLFVPFLFRIGTNLLRSEERKSRRRELLLRMFSSNGARSVENPQSLCLRDELRSRLEEALAALPVQYRSPLLLREVEGWSYREIARALSCEEGTIKSRIHRGRTKLKELLAPYWNGGR